MTTEHDLAHGRAAPRAPSLADDDLLPGRGSRSSQLAAPSHPIAGGLLLRKARDANGVAEGADAAVAAASPSSSMPLPSDVRARFERSTGADLSGVRIHTGHESAEAAHAVGAHAYTVGQDIHFAAGQYAPSNPAGLHLLAHEVAHTVQQRGIPPTTQCKLEVSTPNDAAEVEADHAADALVQGASVSIGGGSGLSRKLYRDAPPPQAADAGKASAGATWNPVYFYTDDNDGLAPASDHYQARNNLDMIVLTLSPLVKGGIPEAAQMSNQATAKKATVPGDGPLTPGEATDLMNFNAVAVLAYRAGVQRMKQTLDESLATFKEPEGFAEAEEEVQELLHEGFTRKESLLEKAQKASEYLHIAGENMHHLIELAETSRQELTMINQWYVKPHESSFENILGKGGELLAIANVIHASLQAVWACASAISANADSTKSTAQQGAAGIEAMHAVGAAGLAAGAFVGIAGAASMGLIWSSMIGPQMSMCLSVLEKADELGSKIAHDSVEDWWDHQANNGGGPPEIPEDLLKQNRFPGGQATLNYMWAVFQGAPPDSAPAPVTKFFYDNRKKLNKGGGGSELDTEWHAFSANEVKNLKEWVVEHKNEVWGMLYGSLPHPRAG